MLKGSSTDTALLTEDWLIKNGFYLFDSDRYQKHYVPIEGKDDPYRWMLSVSPWGDVRLREVSIPLKYVYHLHFLYKKL